MIPITFSVGLFDMSLRGMFPVRGGGAKPLLFTTHKPCQMYKKKPIAVHVTRW
jgi:hypothetical protein